MIIIDKPVPIRNGDIVSIDIEMFGQEKTRLHLLEGDLACAQFAIGDKAWLLTDMKLIKEAIDLLTICKYVVGHNLLYDIRQLRRWFDIEPMFNIWDTMLMEQNLFAGYYDHFSLADLSRRWLGSYMDKNVRESFFTAQELSPTMMLS